MDRQPNDLTTDEEIDAMLDEARTAPDQPRILQASFHPEPGLNFLMLRLDDGRRLLVPREELSELDGATDAQAVDLFIGPNGIDIWWPQIDDGLYLPEFLRHRWRVPVEQLAAA